ncbi:DNA-directed RNA polymerase subunit beta [Erysipelotrichaceae bacterium]|nr:DNA-directed RNA polymerase subunit beta [Erysipelotrichaceae bacterium]
MSENIIKSGRRERLTFSKIPTKLEMPNLIEIQKNSFDWFLASGIDEVFKDVFPISDVQGILQLDFVELFIDDEKYSVDQSKEKDINYARPLRAKMRLLNNETGEIKEQVVFMGELPMMTESGTFIINGAERVVVSQLVRSPGVYFNEASEFSEHSSVQATVIPNRGAWLEYEMDAKGIANIRIDRTRKLPLTVFLRALGLATNTQIFDVYGEHPILETTMEKDNKDESTQVAMLEVYKRLRPGEPPTIESAKSLLYSRFFDVKRYNLARVGRYKLNKKLNILDRIDGKWLAQDVISVDGELIATKGDFIDPILRDKLEITLSQGAHTINYGVIGIDENEVILQELHIYSNENKENIVKVIGTHNVRDSNITIADVLASVSYFLNLTDGVGSLDDIDHLGNRRIRSVGELLQNQFRVGLIRMERVVRERMSIQDVDDLKPQTLINVRPLSAIIKEFFGSSQLSQFMDQHNPLAELTHKRRLSALGPGGLTRERAGFEVRDVHYTHYGRMCPIETPEGPNIGLINSLSTYARINEYGFIQTPFRVVNKETFQVTDEILYVTADQEDHYVVGQATLDLDEDGYIMSDVVVARHRGENIVVPKGEVDLVDVSPKQIVSVAASCIPFLEHDDASRALMGANMQRQAVPLMIPEAPFVGTGMEHMAAKDSGVAILSKNAGIVEFVDAKKILIRRDEDKKIDEYKLYKFERSNHGVSYNHTALVKRGEHIEEREIIADGASMDQGEMALGRNVVVGFMTWNGYNYEDAVIMSERLVKDDVYTSIHIEEYEIECRDTKLGVEEIKREIPNVGDTTRKDLDVDGVIRIGAEVEAGSILVGKVTPKGVTELSPEERLLHAIFGEKAREVRDTSLKVPHGGDGIVIDVKRFTREKGSELSPGVNEVVRVYVAQKRKISEGDKMAGRHGNKGVISRILPVEDMPYLEDGTPIDIMLNPLGVPSRMNIGQVLELHLGMAAKKLGLHIATPVFDGCSPEEMLEVMNTAGMDPDGKTVLYDGRTGEKFDNRVSVGVMYMIKLAHMVDDKLHARSNGPYSLVTQQPLGGKAQFGGQRFGEMEVWALEAYGAANTLQEILTIKSDDINGRQKAYEAIIKGKPVPTPGIPESFRVLVKELQSLAIDVSIYDDSDVLIEIDNLEQD